MALTEEQKKRRMSGIGGSDVAAALGVSKWKTPLQLWGEKTGFVEPEDIENDSMYWGSALEVVIADRFKRDNSRYGLILGGEYQDDDAPWMLASTDGIIVDIDAGTQVGVWEAKTSQVEWGSVDDIPVQYILQVQHYMHITGLNFAIISALFHGNVYAEFRIERDPEYATVIVPKLAKFWDAVTRKLATMQTYDMEDVGILITHSGNLLEDYEVHSDSKLYKLVASISDLQATLKEGEDTIKKLKVELSTEMASKSIKSLKHNGKSIATIVTVADSEVVDIAMIKKMHPKVCEMHKKTKRGYTSLRIGKVQS